MVQHVTLGLTGPNFCSVGLARGVASVCFSAGPVLSWLVAAVSAARLPLALFLVASVVNLLHQSNPSLMYRGPGSERFTLVPGDWNVMAITLFCVIMAMLILPKFLGTFLLALNARERARFGGAAGLFASGLLETVMSVIMAPVMMVFQTGFVVSILSGISVKWDGQARNGRRIALGEALRRHATNLCFGGGLLILVLTLAPQSILWFLPLIAGPLLSPLITTATSSRRLGNAFAEFGLLMTPEETAPCREIAPLRKPDPAWATLVSGGGSVPLSAGAVGTPVP